MPRNSQGDIVVIKGQPAPNTTSTPTSSRPKLLNPSQPSFTPKKHSRPGWDNTTPSAIPAKKARPTPSAGKENVKTATGTKGPRAGQEDEQDFMKDLLSGLDASVFDNFDISPVKPKATPEAVSIAHVKVELESQAINVPSRHSVRPNTKPGVGVASGSKPQTTSTRFVPAFKPLTFKSDADSKHQARDEAKVSVKVEEDVKPANADANDNDNPDVIVPATLPSSQFDEFSFDLDLAALTDIDYESLTKPVVAPQRYPVLHPAVPRAPTGSTSTPWARCVVEDVQDGIMLGGTTQPGLGKTVTVTVAATGVQRTIFLKERWVDLKLRKKDIINVIALSVDDKDPTNPIVITFKNPASFIIHHPDHLVTMTSIANAMPCSRRPLLQSLIKLPGPSTKPIIHGTILHTLLQGALLEQDFSADQTYRRIREELSKEERKLELWGAGLADDDVGEEMGKRAGKGFEIFADKWVGEVPNGELHTSPGENGSRLAIYGLHEVEEDIWSPKWGLKGKVDASVQSRIIPDPSKSKAVQENIAPLEIKTGRAVGVLAHRAQTMLYTLLMEDRYGVPVPAGLLYYSQLDSILRVEAKSNEIRALIFARNELAHRLSHKRSLQPTPTPTLTDIEDSHFLPPTIENSRECKNCYAVDACMLYRKAVDRVEVEEDDPLAEVYEDKTGHMSQRDVEFFKKWEALLTVEEQDIDKFRSQLWTMIAKEREKHGRCFSDMVIESYSNDLGKSMAKIHRHSYTFVRASGSSSQHGSLLAGHIAKGDPVSLSIEPDLLCLSRGFVTDLTPTQVTVAVTYVIDVKALLARTGRRHATAPVPASAPEGVEVLTLVARAGTQEDGAAIVFRIDKDEMASGIMRMRGNLAQLFLRDGDSTRRRLIVDLEAPRFDTSLVLADHEVPSSLNSDQRHAMHAVMAAEDYALILGMPGTGKTTTIAEIIKALVAKGKTVLLSSYTHSAVDTILMKLLGADFPMLRLGNVDKVHPDVQHLTLEALGPSTGSDQMNARLMGPPVVAATCLAMDNPLFHRRKFDYCIVDEASQITLPTCLGPLRMADKFVLVGDHFQLPPIVKNADARRGGLDVSLFRLLSDAHPAAVSDLSHQYRMNEDIMLLSNRLIYQDRLKCGSEKVAKQALVLSDHKMCADIHPGSECGGRCWLQELLDEDVKAVFVDTDLVPARDTTHGGLVQNEIEAQLVWQLANALNACGVNENQMAVITPYRQQIKLLAGMFKPLPKVEILTADKSQGRDKDCVLISLVRSNYSGYIGDLLRDWRRINVSFTRAKKKLVIFGSRRTLQGDNLLKGFFQLMEEKKWIKQLPVDAHFLHGPVGLPSTLGRGSRVGGEDENELTRGGGVGKVMDRKPFATDVLASML